jgi:hypothetical protein
MVNNNWVAHLTHYTMSELRHRQRITNGQIRIAYDVAQQPSRRYMGLHALEELHNMADSLIEAIYIKTEKG